MGGPEGENLQWGRFCHQDQGFQGFQSDPKREAEKSEWVGRREKGVGGWRLGWGLPRGQIHGRLQGISAWTLHRMGRVLGLPKLGGGLGSHLGTRQTSFTRATSFTRRTFGASRARRTTFTSGTLVGGVTGTIRVSSLGPTP